MSAKTPLMIRKVDRRNPQDVELLVSLINAYAEDPMGLGESLSEERKQALQASLPEQAHLVAFIGWLDAEPVGMAVCFQGFSTFQARPLLNVHDLSVKPAFRGRGFGRHLLEHVCAFADEAGMAKVTLEVRADNLRAQSIYLGLGFHSPEGDKRSGMYFYERKFNVV